MAREKRVVFERLSWNDETLPSVPAPLPESSDAEATAALMVLGGFQCNSCAAPLNVANGYACCGLPYCPYCGEEAQIFTTSVRDFHCPHQVLDYGRTNWHVHFDHANLPVPVGGTWQEFLALRFPARKLPGQSESGYPRWTDDQMDRAYTPDVRPHLDTIFGPQLRGFGLNRLGPVLVSVMRPDIRTSVLDWSGHWRDVYFCADAAPALARAAAFVTHLHEGTARLRTMKPQAIVGRDAPAKEAAS